MTNEARMAIHWVHRIGAIVVLLVVGALFFQTVKQAAVIGYALLAALLTQITLGILNVVWVLPCSTLPHTIPLAHCCCWCWLR